MASTSNHAQPGVLKNDSKTYYAIFAVGFAVFLVIALVAQVLGA